MVFLAEILKKPLSFLKLEPLNFSICQNLKKPLSYLKSRPSNLPSCKVWCKIKIFKFRTENVWFAYFSLGILKSYCHIWNQHPRTCLFAKFCKKKQKRLNLGSKMLHLRIFLPKMHYLVIFGLQFLRTIVIFEISTLKFAYLQNSGNLEPQISYLRIFGLEF